MAVINKNVFYVYVHRRGDNNEVFYVGKGKGGRATATARRNAWWTNIYKKYGRVVEYVEKGMSEEDAYDLEYELVKFYRETGHTLCNLTNGGDGTRSIPEAAKKIMTERILSPEVVEKRLRNMRRPVLCSNGMIFDSAKSAAAWLGKGCGGSISVVCKRKGKCSWGGFVWRYVDDSEDLKIILLKNLDAFVEFGCDVHLSQFAPSKVYCSNGIVFKSADQAANWLKTNGFPNANRSTVRRCCNNATWYFDKIGFSWQEIFVGPFVTNQNIS